MHRIAWFALIMACVLLGCHVVGPESRETTDGVSSAATEASVAPVTDEQSAVRAVFMAPERELPPDLTAQPLVRLATAVRDVIEGGSTIPLMKAVAADPSNLVVLESVTGRDEGLEEYLYSQYKVGLVYEPAVVRMYSHGYEQPDLFLDAIFALMRVSDGYMAEGLVDGWHQFLRDHPEFLLENSGRITGADAPAYVTLCDEYLPETRHVLTAYFQEREGKEGVDEVLEWLACQEEVPAK